MKYIIIFILLSKYLSAQILIEANIRSAKADTIFDYYFGTEIKDSICNFELSAYGSFERDNGIYYYQYKGDISHKYFKLSHIMDTEKDMQITSCNLFLKKSIIKIGMDISYTNELLYGGYLALKYKFLFIETAFNGKFYKLQYSINPEKSISDKIKIGLIIKGIMIENSFKWRNGLTFKYNM